MMIPLGCEVGPGTSVSIPASHMVVTGQTQLSGKTTTLEALIARSGLRAVTFVTKRGEKAFAGGRRLQPFFRERADWVFVSSLIDATLGEKNKLLRAWLMKVCRGTSTLAEVQQNVRDAKAKARGFSESIYTEIDGYLELVVPQLAQLPPARGVSIGAGLNVMDLSPYSTELQALVIKSVLEHVYEHEEGVVTVIPEAWEFLPEGRGSPVKREAETLIRKGAALGNFVWLDSQDLAGVWKLAVRAAAVALIGVQREANEIKRTLANIPAGMAKPSAAAIATLEPGQFFACHGRHVVKTYVQPEWMDAADAHRIAVGDASLATAPQRREFYRTATSPQRSASTSPVRAKPDPVSEPEDEPMSKEAEAKLDRVITLLETHLVHAGHPLPAAPSAPEAAGVSPVYDEEQVYQRFKARLSKEAPQLLQVLTLQARVELEEQIVPVKVDGKSIRGILAKLILEGFFKDAITPGVASGEIKRRGKDAIASNVARDLNWFAEHGFLTRENEGYRAVTDMKKHIVK